jgi:DMSO/TMAO reductase YedYZ molybdopterin-dependent catalytic subunit
MKSKIIYIFIVLAMVLVAALQACSAGATSGTLKELESVQIKEYQGQKLSSIGDFHENSIKGPQYVDNLTYRLKVDGLVDQPITYTYENVINNHQSYQKLVTLDCVEGWSVTLLWEGVLVDDLISRAGVKPEAKIVIFHAYDGYTTSLPLQYIRDNNILLAYKMNGVILPPERGFPFELVAEQKWGYKWIKWVTEIELSNDENYRGYWEQAGYSNEGSLDKPFFDR